jgi:hypothetical protein
LQVKCGVRKSGVLLRIVDYTQDIRSLLEIVGHHVDALLARSKQVGSHSQVTAGVEDQVLDALLALYALRRLVGFGAAPIEGGLAELDEVSDSGVPAVRSTMPGKENWDFLPWFCEKVAHLEEELFTSHEICLASRGVSRLPAWAQVPMLGDRLFDIQRRLVAARRLLDIMLELVDAGEFKVQRLDAEDEETTEGWGLSN